MIKTFHETKRYIDDGGIDYFYIKNESFRINEVGIYTQSISKTFEYSFDKVNWTQADGGFTTGLEPLKKMYIRSSNGWSTGQNSFMGPQVNSNTNGVISLGGNLATLIDYTDVDNITTVPNWAFARFGDRIRNNLISISNLSLGNMTTVGDNSFYQSFYQCKFLKDTFDFTNITSIGENGFHRTFEKCNELVKSSEFTNVTSVGNQGMYSTFYDCYSLKKFTGFENLTTVGNMGFQTTFSGCQRLNQVPDFSNVTTVGSYGFAAIYQYCYSLSDVTAPNIDPWDENKMSNWLFLAGEWVSGTKTVYCPTGVTISDNYNGIPYGWVRVDY